MARYSAAHITEEVFNSITHGVGAIAGIVGLVVGVVATRASVAYTVSFVLYCLCLILLMTMSSLYHALSFTRARNVFRVLDHSGIFLLIAGSFTPLTVMLYHGWAEIALLSAFWALAVTGIVFKAALPRLLAKFSVGIYVTMGWLALIFVPKLQALPDRITTLVILGGMLYILGAALLAIRRPFIHTVWHAFVVAAACVHFFAIIGLRT